MILFQEDQTVSFDPMYVDGPVPWYETVYALYIFAIVVVLLARIVQIFLKLRKLRKLENANQARTNDWRRMWGLTWIQANALGKLAILTFFLSCFEFSLQVNEASQELTTMKAPSPKWPLVRLGAKAEGVGIGILIAAILYAFGFFFESRLERRKLAVDAAQTLPQAPTD